MPFHLTLVRTGSLTRRSGQAYEHNVSQKPLRCLVYPNTCKSYLVYRPATQLMAYSDVGQSDRSDMSPNCEKGGYNTLVLSSKHSLPSLIDGLL